MFQISLKLVGAEFTGVEALDISRRLGLGDRTHISFSTEVFVYGRFHPSAEVSEGFARAWFNANQVESEATIPIEFLAVGDCRMTGGNDYMVTFVDLEPDRIKELYIAARFAACRQQVARLTEERDALREQIASADKELAALEEEITE